MIIESRTSEIRHVDRMLEEIKAGHDLDEKLFSLMLTSVYEAVTNSIRHGNRFDVSKKVTVEFARRGGNRFIFRVTDEGDGFDWRSAPEPPSPDRIGGRGLLIMKRLAQKCIFNEKGNSVELHFTA